MQQPRERVVPQYPKGQEKGLDCKGGEVHACVLEGETTRAEPQQQVGQDSLWVLQAQVQELEFQPGQEEEEEEQEQVDCQPHCPVVAPPSPARPPLPFGPTLRHVISRR